MDYKSLKSVELVNLLGDKTRRNEVIRALVGGLTAGELRRAQVSSEAKQALIDGLKHPNSKIRWWCIQLMDHLADETYADALLDAARTDPTPKNRRHAIHALACPVCKPNRERLQIDLREDLQNIIASDDDASVREMARQELNELLEDFDD